MTITTPEYSFIQFAEQNIPLDTCVGIPIKCLPIFDIENDIVIPIILHRTSIEENAGTSVNWYPVISILKGCDELQSTVVTSQVLFNIDLGYSGVVKTRLFLVKITSSVAFNLLECDECFCIGMQFWKPVPGDTPVSVSSIQYTNCFKKICDPCYTSLTTYSSSCNELSFIYLDSNGTEIGMYNKVRLPYYLKHPQFNSKVNGYRNSKGKFKKLSEQLTKKVKLETDYMDELWHEKLKIALSHDLFKVDIFNADTGGFKQKEFYCESPYEIDWKNKYGIAKAKTELIEQKTINYLNSNCC